MPCLPCNPALLLTESSSSFYRICTHSVGFQPTFFSLSISLETRRENKLAEGSSVFVCVRACVCECICFLCSHQSPSPWLIRCPSDRGPQQVFSPLPGPTRAWSQPFLRPALAQLSSRHSPGQLGYTQDKRAGDLPASGSSRGERAGQTEEEEDDLRGLSTLNNLLMGLPSISNFGCKVVRTIVIHVCSNRAKRDFSRVTATAKNWYQNSP